MDLELKRCTRQQLMVTAAMRQALKVLQMPVLELAEWVRMEIERNPVLEYDEKKEDESVEELDFDKPSLNEVSEEPQDRSPAAHMTLYEHLMPQAKEVFLSEEDLKKAENIIGNLDDRGFLGDLEVDEKILRVIQTFDPPGIAARNLRESLLIQLKALGKERSPAFTLIEKGFDDLMKGKRAKDLPLLKSVAAHLDFAPGERFLRRDTIPLIVDATVQKINGVFNIEVNEDPLPLISLSPPDTSAMQKEESSFVRQHVAEGKWLIRTLQKRNQTIKKIVSYLLAKQEAFFNGQVDKLLPLTYSEVAADLGLHESTVARTVSQKAISCPMGIFALKMFFSHGIESAHGKSVSNRLVKQRIKELIDQESKESPLSDQEIAEKLKSDGLKIARRTVAKYRLALKIPSVQFRHL